MGKKVKVQIFGEWDQVLGGGSPSGNCGGCSSRIKLASDESSALCCHSKGISAERGCGGCSSQNGSASSCANKVPKSVGELYKELVRFIESSDVKDYTDVTFIDIRKINILDYDEIRYLHEQGYELPYCVIDDIVRYYGGIVNNLIYRDTKELLEN